MGVWDSLHRIAGKRAKRTRGSSGSKANLGLRRRSTPLRNRDLRVEQFEDRLFLSITQPTSEDTPVNDGFTALDEYVQTADSSFSYTLSATYTGTGYKDYVYDLVSQTWNPEGMVTTGDGEWHHWLHVVVPDSLDTSIETALLFVDGGSFNTSSSSIREEVVAFALSTNSICVDLRMVPNQALQFSDELYDHTEDEIVAYTFDKYLETYETSVETAESWVAYLPMVNSAVRAMDAVQALVPELTDSAAQINDFVVSGASKRGWTTELTTAVDPEGRVKAMIPLVADLLNLQKQMEYQANFYAGVSDHYEDDGDGDRYSVELHDYLSYTDAAGNAFGGETVIERMSTPIGEELLQIVDPFAYRDRDNMDIPKYFIFGTGDQFFVPGSAEYYIDALQLEDVDGGGSTYLSYVPNVGHSLTSTRNPNQAVESITDFYAAVLAGDTLPTYDWTIENDGNSIILTTPDTPTAVRLWQATNPDEVDFRLYDSGDPVWYSSVLAEDLSDGGPEHQYVAEMATPVTGATAFMIEVEYVVNGKVLTFSSSVSVVSADPITPELVSVTADSGDTLEEGGVYFVAPQELLLQFNEEQQIDANTLSAIQVYRAGGDGIFGNGNDVEVTLGYIGVGDYANEVVLRFAESLPDDLYQLRIIGSGDDALTNVEGKAFQDGEDLAYSFELDLGAQVTAVVPQPISRDASTGELSQARDVIEVYFNDDDLSRAAAENTSFYQLIFTNDTETTTDDVAYTPVSAVYDSDADMVTLTFDSDLSAYGTGAFRLRVGSEYQDITTTQVSLVGDAGSAFFLAASLGTLGSTAESKVASGSIKNQGDEVYTLDYPGARDELGHRDLPGFLSVEAHGVSPDSSEGIAVGYYYFPEIYAYRDGEPLYNMITEAQKELTRQIFALYSYYLGVQFVETANAGISIVTGDLWAAGFESGPGGVGGVGGGGGIIIDEADDWGTCEFGGSWFRCATHEIGHALGYGHTYDLPSGTIMGSSEDADNTSANTEAIFPGDYDILHGEYMYIPESVDVDLYRFTVTEAGTLTAETLAERLGNSSLLDSVLTLYKIDDTDPTDYEIVARNDDYFSEDSYLEIYLEPGTYYIGVSASGNEEYDPNIVCTGFGGVTEGAYELRVTFIPQSVNVDDASTYRGSASEQLVDAERGVLLDGDADGVPGGTYNYWFNVATEADTIYVDKTATGTADGTLANPYTEIDVALAAAEPGDVVRIVGNHVENDDVDDAGTLLDNVPYHIGLDRYGKVLEDGRQMEVPQGVTVMIDAGAIIKLGKANIDVGSLTMGVDHSGGSLQVLGTPDRLVYFTSYYNDDLGGSTNTDGFRLVNEGDWGGLVFHNDVDYDEAREVLETEGIFLDYINHADISYGGGVVNVYGVNSTYTPIYLIESRPTITYNRIHDNAEAAISADPNSFEESFYEGWLSTGDLYTSDYRRVGPEISGNKVVDNSINGLLIRITTKAGGTISEMEVAGRFDDTDITHVLVDTLYINGTPGGPIREGSTYTARLDARLVVDPGVVVKLNNARIEIEMGAQLIAEGRVVSDETPGARVVFTSLLDDRYGAGGTFETQESATESAAPRDWSGLMFAATSTGSIDRAVIAYAGGSSAIEGDFASFDPVEIRQAEVRVANTRFENNGAGQADGDRNGRGTIVPATIFVRGAQPVLVNNEFVVDQHFLSDNSYGLSNIPIISIDCNSLKATLVSDWGRSTGALMAFDEYRGNYGPLVRSNRMSTGGINGMEVRGGTMTTESVWDDTDIVHVLRSEIIVYNYHTGGGVRLLSSTTESLVVKLRGSAAGFTAAGRPMEVDDRIGGAVQIIGTVDYPVVLTSLADDTVGAGYDLDGVPLTDTNGDGGATSPTTGDWRSIQFEEYSNDRNVAVVIEQEAATGIEDGVNDTPGQSQYLGALAESELDGDETLRMGFDIYGTIGYDDSDDVDVYGFEATAGTEIWLDIDKTTYALDTVIELVDSAGRVLARSDNSIAEARAVTDTLTGVSSLLYMASPVTVVRVLDEDPWLRSEFSNGSVGYDMYTTNPLDAGMRLVLPGATGTTFTYHVRVLSNSGSTGSYELQVRLGEEQEVAGSSVQYADVRYATNGIEVLGLPGNSPLLGETAEVEDLGSQGENDSMANAQAVGNLLASDSAAISWRGYLTSYTDVDWYKMTVDIQGVQAIAGVNAGGRVWATIFDLDYTDGMAHADLALWVFNSKGELVLAGTNSNVVDDQDSPIGGASLEDLSAGSEGPLDPFIGSVYLQEGDGETYYIAVTSALAVPSALNPLTNPETRLEPIDSITRIAEDHVETAYPASDGSTYPSPVSSSLSLNLAAEAFTLADVTTYLMTTNDLYSLNTYTGSTIDLTGSGIMPDFTQGIAMRNDGRLYAVVKDLSGTLSYRRIDTEDVTQSVTSTTIDITAYGLDPTDPTVLVEKPGALNITAMAHGYDNDYRHVYILGSVSGSLVTPHSTSLLYVLNSDGTPIQEEDASGARVPTDIVPLGELLTPAADGGIITGIAFHGTTMYAVSSKGYLYYVVGLQDYAEDGGSGEFSANDDTPPGVNNDDSLRLVRIAYIGNIEFTSLSLGPQSVEDGAYADMFFATDLSGRVYAFDNNGALQPIFTGGATSVDTGVSGLAGITFTTADYNLWHITKTRSTDAGHGINTTEDYSRPNVVDDEKADYPKIGYQSWYFGLDDPREAGQTLDGPVLSDAGQSNFYNNLRDYYDNSDADAEFFGTYDIPNGAYGRLTTSTFSLANYEGADEPMLYFSYYAETQGGDDYDGFRVYISSGGGSEVLLATNIDWVADEDELAAPGNLDNYLQRIYDNGDAAANAWRQVRINLSDWAGQSDLKLTFEFVTRGSNDLSDLAGAKNNSYEGVYIDDIIIGFAERGEMVTGAPASTTSFTFTAPPTPDQGDQMATIGSYQLEVRRGADYGSYGGPPKSESPVLRITRTFDTNDRLAEEFTLIASSGSSLVSGSTFELSDGINAETFILLDIAVGGSAGSYTPIYYRTTWSATQIADAITDAVNGQSHIDVTAAQSANRVDLFGATGGTSAAGVTCKMWGVDSSIGYDLGDSNTERAIGQVIIANNRISYSSGYGIVVAPSERDADGSNTPHPGSGRAIADENDLVGGISIINNVIYYNLTGGIRISGEENEVGQPTGAIPYVRVINNTISGTGQATHAAIPTITYAEPGDEIMEPNDDESSTIQDLGFTFEFYGGNFTQFYVNNNGNITFTRAYYDYTPQGFPVSVPMVAAFWADVDTRADGGEVRLAWGTSERGNAFIQVDWIDVGYFYEHSDKTNTFRLYIEDDPNGDIVVFDYIDMQWTTGDVESSGGFGGSGAQIGFNAGDSLHYVNAGRPNSESEVTALNGTRMAWRIDPTTGIPSSDGDSIGILVENNASPTLLNNIVANCDQGISVDRTSTSTVLNGNVYRNNTHNVVGTTMGSDDLALSLDDPLFVDEASGNFYLAPGSPAIDSAIGSLEERVGYYNEILEPIGISPSPILAPDLDIYGLVRQDDPDTGNTGTGTYAFADRGAIERADFEQPTASLLTPLDGSSIDQDPDAYEVTLVGQSPTQFAIQLNDASGVGIDDASVTSAAVKIYRNDMLLTAGVDYFFRYDAVNDVIYLVPSAAFWKEGYEYAVVLDNESIRDWAANFLEPNHTDGKTYFTIGLSALDFGDAPDDPDLIGDFPSLIESDGARHIIQRGYYLGSGVSGEKEALVSSTATGDQLDDGISFATDLLTGSTMTVTVTAAGDTLFSDDGVDYIGYLNAWIDFNGDGTWSDDEHLFGGTGVAIMAGTNELTFAVPDGLTAQQVMARFRLSSEEVLGVTGQAPDGEVEDYQLTVVEYLEDFGDAPSGYDTTGANAASHAIRDTGPYLGVTAPDDERDGQPGSTATRDDNTGVDDEDGVDFTAYDGVFSQGREVAIAVTVGRADGYLSVWIDFNGDGDWGDADEHVTLTTDGQTGTSILLAPGVHEVTFTVPEDAVTGDTYARFRVSTAGTPSYDGFADDGEVEDYVLTIIDTPYDFGDAPSAYGTLLADDGARHVYDPSMYLGTHLDYEADGQANSTATGDNITGKYDDEDGVFNSDGTTLLGTSDLLADHTITIVVYASADGGYLNGWLDFNGDRDWADDGEHLTLTANGVTDLAVPLVSGANLVTFTLPGELSTVTTFARFRFSSEQDLDATGEAIDGEVEDYQVRVVTGEGVISGYKFNDLDADGVWDTETETGLANQDVTLVSSSGTTITVQTDSSGYYEFAGLFGDTYSVSTPAEEGWTHTLPSGGSYAVTINSTDTIDLDFGDYKMAHVTITQGTVLEGNSGTTEAHITLHLTESFGAPVTVYYSTADGTATIANNDYVSVSDGSFTFMPQETPIGVWSTPTTIANNKANDYDYSVYGDYIVWENGGGIVFLYDDSTGLTTTLTVAGSDDRYPVVHGTHVVYESKPADESDYEIYLYDIISHTRTRLTDNAVDDLDPQLSDSHVVWSSAGTSGGEIYLYNLSTPGLPVNAAVNISNNSLNDFLPKIAGSRVVWTTYDGSDNEIWYYDGTKHQLSNNSRNDANPVISDLGLVWEMYDGHDLELMAYAFGTSSPVQLTNNTTNDQHAAISGTRLVWEGSDGSDSEIFSYDLATSTSIENISNNTTIDERPQLLGNRLVWHSYNGSNWEVYYKEIGSLTPVTNISNSTAYDWYPQISESFVAWRAYQNGTYEIILSKQAEPEVTAEIVFTINGDTSAESDEYFIVNVTGASSPTQLLDDSGNVQSQIQTRVGILNDDGSMDFGDAPAPYPTLLADNGARHLNSGGYYLGASVDVEANGKPSATATGDDYSTSDDEDGVTFNTTLTPGVVAQVSVVASKPGVLNAWLDFNGDGDWNDLGEQIFVDRTLTQGTNLLTFSVPFGIDPVSTFARFRFSQSAGLSYTGTAATGEVEDYQVSIVADPNLVGRALTINGTTGDDQFEFTAGSVYRVVVNGTTYLYPATAIDTVQINGLGGNDTAVLHGSAGTENVRIWAGKARFMATGLDLWAYAETISVTSGGGDDTVRFLDSAGKDVVTAAYHSASMVGDGYSNSATGFYYMLANSTSGGADEAYLYDSPGNDTLTATPTQAIFTGPGMSNSVFGFKSVVANSTAGIDTSWFYDSPGNDVFTATPTRVTMVGTGYSLTANNFQNAHGLATAGGTDNAYMYDSAGDDIYRADGAQGRMFGPDFFIRARYFDNYFTYSLAGGHDVAIIKGTAGKDTFYATPTLTRLYGSGYYHRVVQYDDVSMYGLGGVNTADLSDSAGDDYLEASGTSVKLTGIDIPYSLLVDGCDPVKANSSNVGDKKHSTVAFLLATGQWEDI